MSDDASDGHEVQRQERMRRVLQVGSDRFLADLASNIRTEAERQGSQGSSYWVGMAQGAAAALVAVGEVPYDKQHDVVRELLRPLVDSGAIQEVTAHAEQSSALRAEPIPDDTNDE